MIWKMVDRTDLVTPKPYQQNEDNEKDEKRDIKGPRNANAYQTAQRLAKERTGAT
jgi:hypothetical protein